MSLINFSSYRCRVSLVKLRGKPTPGYKIHRYPAIYLYHIQRHVIFIFKKNEEKRRRRLCLESFRQIAPWRVFEAGLYKFGHIYSTLCSQYHRYTYKRQCLISCLLTLHTSYLINHRQPHSTIFLWCLYRRTSMCVFQGVLLTTHTSAFQLL